MHIADEYRHARKHHRCWYCGEGIMPGGWYHSWRGTCEGQFCEVKTHPECHDAWQSLYHDRTLMTDEGLDFGEYWRATTVRKDDQLIRPASSGR